VIGFRGLAFLVSGQRAPYLPLRIGLHFTWWFSSLGIGTRPPKEMRALTVWHL
jgi:hypothetical protein